VTDLDLIARAALSHDRHAFSELVRRHQSAVRQFLRHLTRGNAMEADDLAQETFVRAWQNLRDFRGSASLSTWLLGIAHNLWRNAQRRDRTAADAREHLRGEESVAQATHLSDLKTDLTQALQTLSAEEQLAVHLHYQQDMSHDEIAATVQWPVGTVKTRLLRAKEKLRPLLASWNLQT
jgi:RNA polymerase sigma factor (sigma-70 family)